MSHLNSYWREKAEVEGIFFIQASFLELNCQYAGHWYFCTLVEVKSKHLVYIGMGGFKETVVTREINLNIRIRMLSFIYVLYKNNFG